MSTNDVPGANPRNSDELAMGCWAEHEDESLIVVESTEGGRVVYSIFDMATKPVIEYRDAVREFNPYINASDLLEAFITEVGQLDGVDQGEVLRLPIETFINWLILQAAKRDGDSTANLPTVESALPALPAPKTRLLPRCECCGRFIRKTWERARIAFCSPEHMQLKLERLI